MLFISLTAINETLTNILDATVVLIVVAVLINNTGAICYILTSNIDVHHYEYYIILMKINSLLNIGKLKSKQIKISVRGNVLKLTE